MGGCPTAKSSEFGILAAMSEHEHIGTYLKVEDWGSTALQIEFLLTITAIAQLEHDSSRS